MPKSKTRRKRKPAQKPQGPRIDQQRCLQELGEVVHERGLLIGCIDAKGNRVRWEDPKLVDVVFISTLRLGSDAEQAMSYSLAELLEPIIAAQVPAVDISLKNRVVRAIRTEILAQGRRHAMSSREEGWGNTPGLVRPQQGDIAAIEQPPVS